MVERTSSVLSEPVDLQFQELQCGKTGFLNSRMTMPGTTTLGISSLADEELRHRRNVDLSHSRKSWSYSFSIKVVQFQQQIVILCVHPRPSGNGGFGHWRSSRSCFSVSRRQRRIYRLDLGYHLMGTGWWPVDSISPLVSWLLFGSTGVADCHIFPEYWVKASNTL